jgi:hypothetical protein
MLQESIGDHQMLIVLGGKQVVAATGPKIVLFCGHGRIVGACLAEHDGAWLNSPC